MCHVERENYSWREEYYGDNDPDGSYSPVTQAGPPRVIRGPMEREPEVDEDLEPISSSEKLTWCGATVDLGRKTYCKGWAIYHPGNFSVVRKDSWNQKFFKKPIPGNRATSPPNAEDDPRYKPDPKELKCGQIIAVFHRKEWHRGLILKIFEKETIYKVMIVDFGDRANFKLDKTRLLARKFLKFPAQAVKCCLYFDGPGKALTGSKVEWTEFEATQFCTLMDPCLFYMEFVEYELDWDLANPITWRCRVQRILSGHDINRKYQVEKRFVSDMLLELLQKSYEDQKKKEEDEKKNKKKTSGVPPQSLWYSFMKSYSVRKLAECKDLNESMSNFDGVFYSTEKLVDKKEAE